MIIRRFASHYALMPDGTFGKWPVIEITNDGQIVSLSVSPEGFKEQPSLEFRGGILVPGFVDAQTTATTQKHTLEVKDLNRHMASGTLILGADAETFSKFGKRTYPPFLTDNKINSTLNDSVIVSFGHLGRHSAGRRGDAGQLPADRLPRPPGLGRAQPRLALCA
jgi:hypothetical protein